MVVRAVAPRGVGRLPLSMRVSRWVLVMVLASGVLVAGCGEDEPPSPIEVFRAYQADFEAVRQRLRQVPSVLPDGRAGTPSCDARVPPDPPFVYRTDALAESNAEVMMERSLADPDIRMHYEEGFEFGPTHLLTALRWTGPRGPLGDNSLEYPQADRPISVDETLHRLRTRLNYGRATRYVVVLRQVEYVPPEIEVKLVAGASWRTFIGRIVLDAFVVDLRELRLLCRFSVDAEANPMMVVYRVSPRLGIYEDLQVDTRSAIAAQLASLTGGTADAPP